MPSKRYQVPIALKALVQAALPGATVLGLSIEDTKPTRVDPLGLVIIRSGDPGPVEVDLSPPAYNYEHDLPIEIAAQTREQIDTMLVAIGQAMAADRMLGGLCTWLDAEAPTDGESSGVGAAAIAWAEFHVVASYTTASPLG